MLNNAALRNKMINKGITNSLRFNWSFSTKEHLRVIEYVISHSQFPAEEKYHRILLLLKGGVESISLEGINTNG